MMKTTHLATILAIGIATFAALSLAQQPAKPPAIHMVWMGGNDCPPCAAWRRTELPKLQQSPEFKAIKFTYVEKLIGSPVPPSFFLPEEVKPYKEKLDRASAGLVGSPQAAILVNGEVYDFFRGTRRAEDIEKMIIAIRTDGKYPFQRCLKVGKGQGKCDVKG